MSNRMMGDKWMEFTFCHFNDYRNLIEAWTRDPNIIFQKVSILLCHIALTHFYSRQVGVRRQFFTGQRCRTAGSPWSSFSHKEASLPN